MSMYSDVFCKVYNEFGWNYYPEIFGEQLLQWLERNAVTPRTAMDLACGTGILCRILQNSGVRASGMDFSSGMIDIARAADPQGHYDVADMITYRPDRQFDLVTCTGDAVNHIGDLSDVEKIFQNVYAYLSPGGWFVFDILNENEVSTSEPFEMDFTDTTKVWFQMTRPGEKQVNLKIRVYENGELAFEENIRETIHDPAVICQMLERCGFRQVTCADRLLPDSGHGTTWFVTAQKEKDMAPKRDNYALQVLQAKKRFLTYDQQELISRCCLRHDEDYFYITFLNDPYRITRSTGDMERLQEGRWTDGNSFGEVMTILDWLCDSSPHRYITGRWINITHSHYFHRQLQEDASPNAVLFDKKPEAFARACEALGGEKLPGADVCYAIELLDGLRILVQLWHGDEEFPPRLRCLWDENVTKYLRYETTWFVLGLLMDKIKKNM